MGNIFNGINIGMSSLKAQRKSLDTTGHNIANADNEDYSRQKAVHTAKKAYPFPGMNMPDTAGQKGNGVKVSQIKRIRDDFIDKQIREEGQSLSQWEKRSEGLERIELILNEPSDSGLSEEMNQFWESLQDLSNNPEDSAARSTVQQRAESLAGSFNSLDKNLEEYKQSLNSDLDSSVEEVNSLTRRIADLNKQISRIEASGENKANDLMDKRNALYKELNQKVNVQGRMTDNNQLNISLGGINVVSGEKNENLYVDQQQGSEEKFEDQVKFESTDNPVDINNGEMDGIMTIRDDTIDKYREQLGQMAHSFAERFNEVHQQGYDANGEPGGEFFSIPDIDSDNEEYYKVARDIDVNDDIMDDGGRIAAGNHSDEPRVATVLDEDISQESERNYHLEIVENEGGSSDYTYTITETLGGEEIKSYEGQVDEGQEINTADIPETGEDFVYHDDDYDTENSFDGEFTFTARGTGEANISLLDSPGSGNNATALGRVIKDEEIINGETTVMEAFESTVSELGVEGERAQQMVKNQEDMVDQLENRQESVSGVSLDEEMSNLMKYQQTYNASAQMISTTNQMMDSLFQILR
ncbi:MAG: flagellar hook-associated protein FlgK [Halanaerobiaceae bacterium]